MSSQISEHQEQDVVLSELKGKHVLVVTLNRPVRLNAINIAASRALAEIVQRVEADEAIRVAVLTGAGNRSFSAGGDLGEIAAGIGDQISIGEAGLGGLMFASRRKPWIAAVRGMALGGGMELALACDMIVAGQNALFGLPEVTHGILPGGGGVFRVVRSLPRALALEMLATGAPISAGTAHAYGMVNHVIADGSVMQRALELAEAIAANHPSAVQESLAIARRTADLSEAELRLLMDAAGARLLQDSEVRERLAAFLERRTHRLADR